MTRPTDGYGLANLNSRRVFRARYRDDEIVMVDKATTPRPLFQATYQPEFLTTVCSDMHMDVR
jgi:hypothetical protein